MRSVLAALILLGSGASLAQPAAWSIQGTDGGQIVLLGSVHYLREADYPLPQLIDTLYRQADRIYLEIDLDDIDAQTLQRSFMLAATLPADTRLENVLSEEVYSLAVATAAELNVELALMNRLEPWLVANTMLDVGMVQAGFAADRGIEQYMVRRASQDGIEILGLETAEDQIAIFDELEPAAQEAMLEQTLEEIATAATTLDEMIAAWRAGNLDSLSDSLLEDFAAFPGLYDRLVVERNRNWVEQLTAMTSSSENVLVVVGALHLVGDDSVVQMLRQAGYTVERVP